ncbi:MAG: D-glycero-beta-D-manno-heptose-7-phosphate kinase [Nitrospira sp.]|nr:D-glycero-beta-D-manno-heptose-7-phosphate kinase [Nitrospira sp.]
MNRLLSYVDKFPKAKILVVGDLMVDHYIWGNVSRISPEAPVPVVEVTAESIRPGGAANVFNNIVALEGQADLCGVIGADESGRWLQQEVKQCGANIDGLVSEDLRPTIQKTRIVAHSQQVVRYDREKRHSISSSTQHKIFEFILNKMESNNRCDCLVLSDYAKGVITQGLAKDLLSLAKKNGVSTLVDPKVSHMDYYREVTVVTPNHLEASQASGVNIINEQSLLEAGHRLLQRLNCESVLITRGEKGMSLFEKNGEVTHIPTMAKAVFDVTGAGDTVVGTLALGLAAGATLTEAATLANYAAGVVVGIVGTATVSRQMLKEAIRA